MGNICLLNIVAMHYQGNGNVLPFSNNKDRLSDCTLYDVTKFRYSQVSCQKSLPIDRLEIYNTNITYERFHEAGRQFLEGRG